MPSCRSEALFLTKALLEEIDGSSGFLASQEDCDVFRKWASQQTTLVKKPVPPPEPIAAPRKKAMEEKTIEPPLPKPEPIVAVEKPNPTETQAPKPKPKPDILESPEIPIDDLFTDLRKIWAKITPEAPLLDALPNDEIAKKIAARWKVKNGVAEISILSYHEPPAQKALLEQIAKAVNILIRPTQIVLAEPIEKEKQWETFLSSSHLKYTIACDYTLWQLGGLMHYYRETPTQGTRHLGTVPLFLLPDLSLYLKDPLLKRSLWKALCQVLCS